jgi:hypothetical protein
MSYLTGNRIRELLARSVVPQTYYWRLEMPLQTDSLCGLVVRVPGC